MKSLHLSLDHLPASINHIYLAFSGGIDSMVLLHALLQDKSRYRITLWHINHGLQSNADQMQAFAEQQAQQLSLQLRIDHLNLDPATGNLEARARHQRYDLFAQAMSAQDVLMTAHHMNDQAETLLLNLMRGAGPSGLSAIAEFRALGNGWLSRPLLHTTRAQIEHYAEQHNLAWIDDPSNQDQSYDRNYVRHQLLPKFQQRWPAALPQLHRVSLLQQESDELQHELAEQDLQMARLERPYSHYPCLSHPVLAQLSEARQKNLIRFWLKQSNGASIGYKKMHELLLQLNSRADALPLLQGKQFQIRHYQQAMYLVPELTELKLHAEYSFTDVDQIEVSAIGLRRSRSQLFAYLQQDDKGQQLSLHFRQAGARGANPFQHRLKRLYQKQAIPPWLRDRIPQIYLDGELIELWLFQ
ncbi:MAG: tRNA lysidine(34) synthetase TilS [Gammaproteobacteria bacterium]|nr:tRNA lysidine(34) synthetase TilS [Gammaproteobacteria bacterium]